MVGTTTLVNLSRIFGRQLSLSQCSPSSLSWSSPVATSANSLPPYSSICSFSSSPLTASNSLTIPEVPEGTYARCVNLFLNFILVSKSVFFQKRCWTITWASSLLYTLAQKTRPAVQVKNSSLETLLGSKTFLQGKCRWSKSGVCCLSRSLSASLCWRGQVSK